MVFKQNPFDLHNGIVTAFLDRLQRLFAAMDLKYTGASEHHGFQCIGCVDNCCRTRFYHHTYLEYLYIFAGLEKLAPQRRREIQKRAKEVCRKTAEAEEKSVSVRSWCPLNFDDRCVLYPFRPMICRLHGIPYQLQKPGQEVIYGPGCETFDERCADKSYFEFDRTPFYFEMAKLEGEFKKAAGLTSRIKMTVAEMILRMVHSAER